MPCLESYGHGGRSMGKSARAGKGTLGIGGRRRGTQLVDRLSRREGGHGGIVCICADVGMGKTALLEALLMEETLHGARVTRLRLDTVDSDSATTRIIRASKAQSKAAAGRRCAFAIESVPPGSPSQVSRQAEAIRRMVSAGVYVVITLLPESGDLMEELSEARWVRSSELVDAGWWRDQEPAGYPGDAWQMTHDMHALLRPYLHDGRPLAWEGVALAGGYQSALALVIRGQLRDALPEEERRVRLAMMLMGRGSLEDLALVVGRTDEGAFEELGLDAPFFGIDSVALTFETAGLVNDEVFLAMARTLQALCAGRPQVPNAVSSILARKGRLRRAARVCELGGDERALARLCQSWSVPLICSGEAALVQRVIDGAADGAPSLGAGGIVGRQALRELTAPHSEAVVGRGSLEGLDRLGRRQVSALRVVQALGATRDLWAGAEPHVPQEAVASEEEARLLCLHFEATRRMIGGRISDAYDALVNEPERLDGHTLGTTLVCCDFALCGLLLGEAPLPNDRAALEAAIEFAEASIPGRCGAYLGVLPTVARILMGRAKRFDGVERLIALADRSGDRAIQVVLLVVAAIADARMGAFARCGVRARDARMVADGAGMEYLGEAAGLVELAAGLALGARVEPRPIGRHSSALGDIARMFVALGEGGAPEGVRLDSLDRGSCPRETLWALNFLMRDCGEWSQAFCKGAPTAWIRYATDALDNLMAEGALPDADRPPSWPEAEPGDLGQCGIDGRPVRINVYGGLSVTVQGREVDSRLLVVRRVRDLITLLAVVPRHELARRDVINALWGDADYLTGKQRLYETTAAARRALRGAGGQYDPLVSARGDGLVSLNGAVVSCDVDDLRREVEQVMTCSMGDRAVMEHAIRARHIRGGGLPPNLPEVSGAFERASRDLETDYANAMVVASDAALRIGRRLAAEGFAREALALDQSRDDARACLVAALGALGRTDEVLRIRDGYRRQLERGSRMRAPSLELALKDALSGTRQPGEPDR